MPEENIQGEELNEQVEETVDDAEVITVPIDTTLTRSGEAADAKAVGDALAGKADRSEVQSNIKVNGQSKDANDNITVRAEHIPYDTTGNETVKSKLDELAGKTAETIPMTTGESPQSIAEAIDSLGTKTADQIPMSAGSIETVAGRFETVQQSITQQGQALTQYAETTDQTLAGIREDLDDEFTDAEIHALVTEVFQEGGE